MGDADLFTRNLAALKARWPEIARRVEAASVPEGAVVEPSRQGDPTLRVISESGEPAWIHSRYRPTEEARRQISEFDLASNDSVIVLGLGLAHAVLELARRAPSTTFIVVAEREPGLLRLAMEHVDLTGFLRRREIDLVVGATREEMFTRLHTHVSRLLGGALKIFAHPASRQAFPAYYDQLIRGLHDFTVHGAVSVRSALFLARISIQNQFGNLPEYIASPGLLSLAGRFRGYPAILVGAGPSLEKNLEELRRAEGRAIIIAVSTAMKILLGRGIRPDLTAIIDYHNVSARYFESVPPEQAVPIVCDPKANCEAVLAYSGPKLFCNDPLMNTLLEGVPGDKGSLVMGATVAHVAFDIARVLGCDPIVMVGLDLSYPEGRHHAGGTAQQRQQFTETSRYYTYEMKELEWCLLHRKKLVRVPAIGGGEVWTSDIFFSYLREFEGLFRGSTQRIIDATEGGALKSGTEILTLREAIDLHARQELPESVADLARDAVATVDIAERYERCLEALDRRLEEVEDLQTLYRKSIQLVRKILRITEGGEAADEVVLQVEPIKREFRKHDFLYYLLNHFAQADLFVRVRDDRDIEGTGLTGVEKQHRQARRDLEYVRGLSHALAGVESHLRRLRLEIRRRLEALETA